MLLPHFIIIGAMKCGTTSLYRYLKNHPDIHMSAKKETNYFLDENFDNRPLRWYASHFSEEDKLRGEASTSYAKFPTHTKIPERIFSVVPDVKLIYLVRDPFERMLSHYYHEVIEERETRSFEEIFVRLQDEKYFIYSKYHHQIIQYLDFFSKEKILVMTSEKLREHKKESLEIVYRFLCLKSQCVDKFHENNFNITENKIRDKEVSGVSDQIKLLLKEVEFLKRMRLQEKYDYLKRANLEAYKALHDDAARFRALTENPCENWGI